MNVIKSKNARAIALKEAFQYVSDMPQTIFDQLASPKVSPYYGFADIEISGVPSFAMFSNNDDFVVQAYFWKGADAYESTSLKLWTALARRSASILDVGAYSGVYSLAASKASPKSKIYAIEALDRVYSRLLINKAANSAANINCFNFAVSDCDSEIELLIYSGQDVLVSGSSTVPEACDREPHESKRVKSLSLDSFIQSNAIPNVGLIKIDAEGAEHLILKGAHKTISSALPDIICELLPAAKTNEIISLFGSLGYRYYKISESTMKLVEHLIPPVSVEAPDYNTFVSAKSKGELLHLLPGFEIITMD
ncbi:methyltransferase, FkbM family domain protein [Pseudomonas fluorescens]|uniref:Methyltransferase, FkbM family domain protein n=1 Tax=Pseudomonas fluorescens TaxID=294 RepID=A0A0P8X5D9_PSEFL|nr:FkbM family methyltransferase [Pseudomonas fluorescens]KPU61406.1 methyltransferase, FkbM family domain protein [Pseudomonas fluorescens]